jgi:hypothetical protein
VPHKLVNTNIISDGVQVVKVKEKAACIPASGPEATKFDYFVGAL